MTREEEIKKEAKNKYPYIKGLPQTLAHQEIFTEGAKWADETMIEKVCEWIKENIDIYAKVVINPKSHYPEIVMCDTFEKNFKKAIGK